MFKNLLDQLAFKDTVRRQRPKQALLNWESLEPRQLLAADAGFVGSYYASGEPDSSPALIQHDALIDFDWGQQSRLDNTADSDGFSARWESNLQSIDRVCSQDQLMRCRMVGLQV